MPTLDISEITNTDLSNTDYFQSAGHDGGDFRDSFRVAPQDTDSPQGQTETTWIPKFARWNGYYRIIPEFAAVIDKLASWTVGRGYTTDARTMKILKKIRGWGKDDFNSILENQLRVAMICGDSFAEIVRDKAGRIINFKPLNAGSIMIVVNKKGMIDRYEQIAPQSENKNIIFKLDEIFHLSWNREGDEIHGVPFGEKVEKVMKMRNESLEDLKVIFHRYAKPITIIPVDSDDQTVVNALKTKYESAYQNSETMLVPKGTIDTQDIKHVSIPQFSTLDPLPYQKYLVRLFTTAAGVPEVILGWGEETTEASSKIIYLAFQQTIEGGQRFLESQLELQAGIKIELEFPASIEPMAESAGTQVQSITTDAKKDSKLNSMGVDPNKNTK